MFATIGSMFGPVGTAIGMGADYLLKKRDARRNQEVMNDMAIQQEKRSIQGRVDAAKAAGIHPLVAMGAQGLGGPVVSAPSIDTGFMSFAPEPRRQTTVSPDNRTDDQRRRDAAEADLAELQVEAARRRLATQPGNGGAPNQMTGDNTIVPAEATPYPVQGVKIEGQTLPPSATAKSYQTPGVAPGWDVVEVGKTSAGPVRMVVPGGSVDRQNWGEQLGELPLVMWPDVVRQSAEASNMTSSQWLYKMVTGNDPNPALRPKPVRPPDPKPTYRGGSRHVYGPVN